MARKSNIEEMIAASGFDNLASAYFLILLEEDHRQLLGKIKKREQTTIETHWFGCSNEKAVAGLEGLVEFKAVDRQTLLALESFIDVIRDGIVKKENQVELMGVEEAFSDG